MGDVKNSYTLNFLLDRRCLSAADAAAASADGGAAAARTVATVFSFRNVDVFIRGTFLQLQLAITTTVD